MLYEVSLCIRNENSASKLSYYERWLINRISPAPYFQPILKQVFKRNLGVAAEPQDQWYVLVDSGVKDDQQKAFRDGRKLIRDFFEGGLFNNNSLCIKD